MVLDNIQTHVYNLYAVVDAYRHTMNRIGGVIVSVLVSSAVDRGFELRSGQIKEYKISMCCFSVKHAALRRNCKDWMARNQVMCPSGATCLPADWCFSELAL